LHAIAAWSEHLVGLLQISVVNKLVGKQGFTRALTAGMLAERDKIFITDGGELRTIAVNPALPPSMARQGLW